MSHAFFALNLRFLWFKRHYFLLSKFKKIARAAKELILLFSTFSGAIILANLIGELKTCLKINMPHDVSCQLTYNFIWEHEYRAPYLLRHLSLGNLCSKSYKKWATVVLIEPKSNYIEPNFVIFWKKHQILDIMLIKNEIFSDIFLTKSQKYTKFFYILS